MKKKVLIFHPIIPPYRVDFFNAIASRFHSEICLFWRNLKDQTFDYEKIRSDFNFDENYLVKEEIGLFSWIRGIWRLLKNFRPNVVIGAEFGISTIVIILHKLITFSRYKVIIMCDDSYDMIANHNQFSFRHTIAKKLLMPFIDDMIVVDSRVAEYYQSKCRKGLWFPIIYDEVRQRKKYEHLLSLSNVYVDRYNLGGKKVLLFVGRLVAIKNVAFALQIFLNLKLPDAVFVIVGDGPERPRLEQLAKETSNVVFTGRLEGDELYAWYNVAQLFILPSLIEPYGAVVSEALVAGCRVLVSRRAGSSSLICKGINGELFDPTVKNELVQCLHNSFSIVSYCVYPLKNRGYYLNVDFKTKMDLISDQINS